MGDGGQILYIVLFAAIAGFLILRLRSVLGRRTGTERRRDPFAAPPMPPPRPAARAPIINGSAVRIESGKGIAAVKAADPSFAEDTFLRGARGAFEIILNAFAAGDTAALQPLLSKNVFEPFAAAIRARKEAKQTLQTTLTAVKSADIADAAVEGTTALVTVKFVSDQVNATRDAAGKVIDGDPDRVVEHIDLWTFARPLRSRDPNWTLVATQSP